MKPATSLCCLRRSVEYRRCTTTSPPTATRVATATIRRPVRTRILGSLLPESRLARRINPLGYEKEHDAKCRWQARTSDNSDMKLSEKGFERRSEHGFGLYIGAKTGRTVRCRCSEQLRFGCLQDFSDSFKGLDFSHLGVKGIDMLPTPLHNKR